MSTLSVATIKSITSAGPVFQNTSGLEMGVLVRAWVNFDGTTNTGGVCTIRDSFNVSSVTDVNTGTYTANFATAFSDNDYCAFCSGGHDSNSSTPRGFETVYNYQAGSVKFDFRDESGNEQDAQVGCLVVVR